jgi:peroxiredoxin
MSREKIGRQPFFMDLEHRMAQQPDEQLLERAEQLLREGKHQQASPLLEEYLHSHRDSARAWWALSFALQDRLEQIECIEKVLVLKPSHSAAYARLQKLKTAQSSVPGKPLQTAPAAPRAKKPSKTLQYAVLAVMGCFALGLIGAAGVFLLRGGRAAPRPQAPAGSQAAEISLPPTWTPTISPTPPATRTPIAAFSTLALSTPNNQPALQTAIALSKVGVSPGYNAPDFSLVEVSDNSTVRLSDYKGRGVIIYFWATWCRYCNQEMDDIQAIYNDYYGSGVTVLGLDVGESASLARKYRNAKGLTFPILDDSSNQVAATFHITGFPTHVFVDPNGVITYIASGALDYNNLELLVREMMNMQ